MMKKFDIEIETKMRLRQAQFERRNLELEMQMKELETRRHLLEEERELEREVKISALENDDVRSQSISAWDNSTFNCTPNKREVSDGVNSIDNLLTHDRSTARFEATPEVNRHSHFSRYRSSQDFSSSVEDREDSPRAGLRYSSSYSVSSNLPKPKLNNFDGNHLEWLDWFSMFIATVDQWPIPNSEEMSTWKPYWQAKQCQQTLEWAILDSSMVLHGSFWKGNLEGLMWSLTHNWRVFAKRVMWNLTTQQVWSVSQFLFWTLWMGWAY